MSPHDLDCVPSNSTRRRAVLARAALLTASAMLLAACSRGEANNPPGPPPPPPVSVAPAVERQITDWNEFSGRLVAVEQVELRSRVSGYLRSIHFRPGQLVRKGDLLFQVDPRPFEAALARAEASLASARTRAELARTELARAERLVAERAIAQRDVDERAAAKRDLDASILAAEAAVKTARLDLEYASIRAPISGRISKEEVTVGNLIQGDGPSPTLLTSLVSVDPIYAEFEGDEQIYLKYMQMARSGERPSSRSARNPVLLGLANEQGFPRRGYMVFLDNRIDPKSGTIRARAEFDNKDGALTPGLFARVRLLGGDSYKAVMTPERAIGTDQSKRFVLVVGADGIAQFREVKLGALVDGMRVVRDGLKPGELVVVNGLQRVRPGAPVTPEKMEVDENGMPIAKPAPTPAQGKAGA
ncbi:MAG TPA: efflux RND transporter periplasmic adaptor subunit [Rhodocyclaceae bacterium]|nr:efflux RND transporter periplasmic adaptor subunit [Rhodocyclaceae bacterium]HNB80246.1 efflux RND transporter periplasmic adaptor subunit [Rhodocyclaceae bacterium]HNH14732.1 efflux RND transporter periplasmic adaptor subunit [Rhodocyclaceae bacterium]HNI00557.1 efflux RND transporter periplasmic adaptor subunit [Rhodocyclaceae bacterium]